MSTEQILLAIAKTERSINFLQTKLVDLEKQLIETCDHSDCTVIDRYYSGDYCNKAHTDHITICNICGGQISISSTYHNYYG
jgi:hypothetical protein